MFDIGWGELVIIGIVALIAIGPKELPGVLRSVGQWTAKIRRMAAEFQGQFQEALREAEMADLKKTADDLNAAASSVTTFDPLSDTRKELQAAFEDKPAVSAAPAPIETPPPAVVDIDLPPTDLPPEPPAPIGNDDLPPAETASPKKAGSAA